MSSRRQYQAVDNCKRLKSDVQANSRSLVVISVLCFLFMVGEVVGGCLAHSLAILTDAAHLLGDLAGFLISLFSMWLVTQSPTSIHSFGFHRAEALGALLSVFIIWAVTGVLVYE